LARRDFICGAAALAACVVVPVRAQEGEARRTAAEGYNLKVFEGFASRG
jgi:hypothetical protein